jgi:hypothetical protein
MSKREASPADAVSYLLKLAERISKAEEQRQIAEEVREAAERRRAVAEISRVRAEERRVRGARTRDRARTKGRSVGNDADTMLRIASASDLDPEC